MLFEIWGLFQIYPMKNNQIIKSCSIIFRFSVLTSTQYIGLIQSTSWREVSEWELLSRWTKSWGCSLAIPRSRENWFHLALESLGCANGSISTCFNYGSYQYPYKSSDDVCYGSYQYPYKSSDHVCLHIWSNTPVINIWCKTSNRIALIRMDKEIFASQTTWSGIWHNAFF